VAILTLGLGIGANTAIFRFMDALLMGWIECRIAPMLARRNGACLSPNLTIFSREKERRATSGLRRPGDAARRTMRPQSDSRSLSC
jgi:hypothetical protein